MEVDLGSGARPTPSTTELRPAAIESTSDEALAETLRERLDQAVERHLIADVPMGIF